MLRALFHSEVRQNHNPLLTGEIIGINGRELWGDEFWTLATLRRGDGEEINVTLRGDYQLPVGAHISGRESGNMLGNMMLDSVVPQEKAGIMEAMKSRLINTFKQQINEMYLFMPASERPAWLCKLREYTKPADENTPQL